MKQIEMYTDGACRGNPGPGGWGALMQYDGRERELSGGVGNTTNNRMELTAAIEGLNALREPCSVALWTDSEYVRRGITEWLANWKRRQWRTSANKPVKNADLWQALEQAAARHQISWHWVKGHDGNPGNERADALANRGVDELLAAGKQARAPLSAEDAR